MLDDNNDACKSLAHKKVEYNYQNKFFTATATISVSAPALLRAPPSCFDFVCLKVSPLKVSPSQLCGCCDSLLASPKKSRHWLGLKKRARPRPLPDYKDFGHWCKKSNLLTI